MNIIRAWWASIDSTYKAAVIGAVVLIAVTAVGTYWTKRLQDEKTATEIRQAERQRGRELERETPQLVLVNQTTSSDRITRIVLRNKSNRPVAITKVAFLPDGPPEKVADPEPVFGEANDRIYVDFQYTSRRKTGDPWVTAPDHHVKAGEHISLWIAIISTEKGYQAYRYFGTLTIDYEGGNSVTLSQVPIYIVPTMPRGEG